MRPPTPASRRPWAAAGSSGSGPSELADERRSGHRRREELHGRRSGAPGRQHLAGRQRAREAGDSPARGPAHQLDVEMGRDQEPGAGIEGALRCRDGQDRARADQQVRPRRKRSRQHLDGREHRSLRLVERQLERTHAAGDEPLRDGRHACPGPAADRWRPRPRPGWPRDGRSRAVELHLPSVLRPAPLRHKRSAGSATGAWIPRGRPAGLPCRTPGAPRS